MNTRLHFVGEDFVHGPLSRDRRHSLECFAHEDHVKVPTSFARTGVAGVRRTLIDDIEFGYGAEGFTESLLDVGSGVHGS